MAIFGVANVNTTNITAIMQSIITASFFEIHDGFSFKSIRASYIYTAAADIKKIAILIQSGDVPITPLYV